jgi:hypothetical protein
VIEFLIAWLVLSLIVAVPVWAALHVGRRSDR